jgi:predicted permease
VVAEVALSLTLLVASVLLVKGYLRLQTADFGWEKDNVLTLRLALPEQQYPDDETVAGFYRELLPILRSIPGVESVGGTHILPMQGNSNTFFEVPGRDYASLRQRPLTEFRTVFPEYFTAMGTPMLSGRQLNDQDRPETQPVVVVNQRLVDLFFPDEDPIGRQIEFWGETREIVGVVHNTLDVGQNPGPMTFMSAFQHPVRSISLVVRTVGDPLSVIENVRREILRLDPDLPVFRAMSLEDHMNEAQGGNTIMAKVMAVLAFVALILSVVGVYGIMGYWVSQRTRELGVRMALGAQPQDVLVMVVRQGAQVTLIGIAAGIVIALLVTRSLSVFLFGVSPFDLMTFGGVSFILLVSALGATFLPGRRATRVDPLEALRYE